MYPRLYIQYLAHFHGDRDYFECHELLEEYWKSLPAGTRSFVWVGLIQVAVGLYHQRRGNFPGAIKMIFSAVEILSRLGSEVAQLGLDQEELLVRLHFRLAELHETKPYHSLNLPITDAQLLLQCEAMCNETGFSFGLASNMKNDYLLHKHTMRDRTDVIRTRDQQLQAKRSNRPPSKNP